jgi:hypothetical protein
MSGNSTKNHVCNILTIDEDGKYRKLFSIEGDKPDDPSVYIYNWSNGVNNPNKGHYSYHSKKDSNGLVRVHLSNIKDVSKRQQQPLDQRQRVMCSHHFNSGVRLGKFPFGVQSKDDICLTGKPEYFNSCEYVFYTTEQGLREYAAQKSLVVLHKYPLPVKHVARLHFAVLMREKTLIAIQTSR